MEYVKIIIEISYAVHSHVLLKNIVVFKVIWKDNKSSSRTVTHVGNGRK